jgi:thiol-disulfide isomerase/thioredoxin
MKKYMKRKITLMGIGLLLGMATAHAQQLDQYRNADPKELVNRKDLSQQELASIQRYYKFQLKDNSKAAEMERQIIAKYPKGDFARLNAFQKMSAAKNNPEVIKNGDAVLKAFPYAEWRMNPNGQSFIYYNIHRMMGTAFFETRQFDKLLAFCAPLDYKAENEIFRWNIMRAYTFKMLGQDTLYHVATPLIKDLVKKVKDRSYEEDGVFNKEKAQANADEQLDNQLGTYINLLRDLKKYDEAKTYFAYRSPQGAYSTAEINDIHLDVLEKTGGEPAIQPLLEQCAKANAMTPRMLNKLKALYVKKQGNADGYEQYLSSLRSREEQDALKAYVKEHLVREEFKPFAVQDADGKLVRSSDWENKVVVIDFWATWCKPCIMAFPGMQLLTDKYAADDKVKVYLMGTMQTGDYKQKSTGYVKSEGFRFHLLHDNVSKATGGQDEVFKSFVPFFQSSAIPRKVILKDGVMRYTSEGYSGSPSKLAEELSIAIEILKNEE